MEDFKNKFLVLTFLLILSVPLYGWVVQVVNGLGPKDLTDSFVLESQRQAGASTIFQIGDTLVVAAESQLASTYMLDIYENSSLIIVKHGEFNEAQIEVEVLLSPQMFSAGHTYAAVFHVNSYNKFIPGTFFTDTVVSAFTVVSVDTKLGLSVERCSTNTEHTVYARLIRARDSTPIADQLIKLDVNGTVYTLTTNSTGYVRQALKLETIGGQATTYQVKATFEGTNPQTRSLEVTDPYGKEYAVCTTIQYGYKPSSNSASLTVEPPKTDVTAPAGNEPPTQSPEGTTVSIPPPKTPEQLQQEAEQSGALTVWHEFTWWYPWYRLHIKIHVNPTIDIGFNPILPGGEVADWSGLEFFGALVGEVLEETLIEAFALIGAYLVARTIGIAQPWIGVAIEAGKISAQALLFLSDWDDALRMLAAGLVSIAMSFFAIVNFYVQPNIFMKFVDALWSLCGSAQGALRWMLMRLTEMALLGKAVSRSWMDAVEATADFVIGLTALLRYVDLTT